MKDGCVFCDYAGPSKIIAEYPIGAGVLIFEPLRPIVPGHVLVVPRRHAEDFADNPVISSDAMAAAGYYTRWARIEDANLITSRGPSASQTVKHVHLHIVPRRWGDDVTLPWRNPNKCRWTLSVCVRQPAWRAPRDPWSTSRMAATEAEARALVEDENPRWEVLAARPMFERERYPQWKVDLFREGMQAHKERP